jgi:hypothetical protein
VPDGGELARVGQGIGRGGQGREMNLRRTTESVAVHRRPSAQARQNLDAIDPEPGSQGKASNSLASANV